MPHSKMCFPALLFVCCLLVVRRPRDLDLHSSPPCFPRLFTFCCCVDAPSTQPSLENASVHWERAWCSHHRITAPQTDKPRNPRSSFPSAPTSCSGKTSLTSVVRSVVFAGLSCLIRWIFFLRQGLAEVDSFQWHNKAINFGGEERVAEKAERSDTSMINHAISVTILVWPSNVVAFVDKQALCTARCACQQHTGRGKQNYDSQTVTVC